MPEQLKDIVRFRGDRLFNGAVSINWFKSDESKSLDASNAFVFHGPGYHGVSQVDIGTAHGHSLKDTAGFSLSVARRCYGLEDVPFTLAIAGYGTGKSHLGLTLANLFSCPESQSSLNVLSAIERADSAIGQDLKFILQEYSKPCLVVALNGMQSFDFCAEFTKQIISSLKRDGHDTQPLDDLRPRFSQAVSLIKMSNDAVVSDLVSNLDAKSQSEIIEFLEQQDEKVYSKVHDFFAARGMTIRALSGESVKDVIDIAVCEYCGPDKAYRNLLILFDEFGKYTEFATVRSQIAGSGVLQELFEGVQANSGNVCFVGFIQFDLNTYYQRMAPEYKNEILRYVTRYQAADKLYLSINLETLIANLLEKSKQELINQWFDAAQARQKNRSDYQNIARWFTQSANYRIWSDFEEFHKIICKGCWPLSPYAIWFLFFLASAGKHLQERSSLALLSETFSRFSDIEISEVGQWCIAPSELWSEMLEQELLSSEEIGQQGSITHSYTTVISKHGSKFSKEIIFLLRSVVIASKLGLQVDNWSEAVNALATLSGLTLEVANQGIRTLQEDYNVLEWDESFRSFDIIGDSVPRTQFLSFIRQKVSSSFDEAGKAQLFVKNALDLCDHLGSIEGDFADLNKITTKEWRYEPIATNLGYIETQIKFAVENWKNAIGVDQHKGTVIYVYLEPNSDPEVAATKARKMLKSAAREVGQKVLPIFLIFLHDSEGVLGQCLAEHEVLTEISESDKAKFGNLVNAHKEKSFKVIQEQIKNMILDRNYVTGIDQGLKSHILNHAGTELFQKIYPNPIPFPFDGFATSRGNAATTCSQFTRDLLNSKLDFNAVLSMPVHNRNRAIKVLKESWGVFSPQQGNVTRRPSLPVVSSIIEKWDRQLNEDKKLSLYDSMRKICEPPYGANIASAGLLLGVYIAPRADNLAVLKDGQQKAVSQWLQDDVFKGKFVDLIALKAIELVQIGEASAEWELLLDEWEQAESYLGLVDGLKRAKSLQNTTPIPPNSSYRFVQLENKAHNAVNKINEIDESVNNALTDIEKGFEREKTHKVCKGAAKLKGIIQRMNDDQPLWTNHQIEELMPHLERSRQIIIQYFPVWLDRQLPRGESPDQVGQFKHFMINVVGSNLKKLDLDDLYSSLESHTMGLIRRVEVAAEARHLLRTVSSWLDQNTDAFRVPRLAHLRGLKEVGTDFSNKLKGMSTRIQLAELTETRSRITNFLNELKKAEKNITDRAADIWNTSLLTRKELQDNHQEIEALVPFFEGCDEDLGDLIVMRNVLQRLAKEYKQLKDERLDWTTFEAMTVRLKSDLTQLFQDEEIPWIIEDVLDGFYSEITNYRISESHKWLSGMQDKASQLKNMTAAEANKIYNEFMNHPSYITEEDRKQLEINIKTVEDYLNDLNIQWLIERFLDLPQESKIHFLQLAKDALGN